MEEHKAKELGFYPLVVNLYRWALTREVTASELSFKETVYEGYFEEQGRREEIWSWKMTQKNTAVDQTRKGSGLK